jgi:hypothetical protein
MNFAAKPLYDVIFKTIKSWERLWKALYVEGAGPVTARVGSGCVGAVCRGSGPVTARVGSGCGRRCMQMVRASNSPSWERLWKALYVEGAGPVTA